MDAVKSPPSISTSPPTFKFTPIFKFFAIPTPPSTTNAPSVLIVLSCVPFMFTLLVASFFAISILVALPPKLIVVVGLAFKRLNVEVDAVKSPPSISTSPTTFTFPSKLLLPKTSKTLPDVIEFLFIPTTPCNMFLPNAVESGVLRLYAAKPISPPTVLTPVFEE